MGALRSGPAPEDVEYVRGALAARGGPAVPLNFAPTAPGHDGRQRRGSMPQRGERNSQVGSLQLLDFGSCWVQIHSGADTQWDDV